MKTLARIACISLILPFISAPYSFAEESEKDAAPLSAQAAKDLIASMPGAKDATSGSVEQEVPQDFYDSYGRQLQYRENVKEFRSMLEARRESFTTPHVTAKSRYRDNLAKVYKAESAVYQDTLVKEDGAGKASVSSEKMKNEESMDSEDSGLVDVVDDIFDTSDENEGLKEEVVSSDVDVSDGEAMKKVITSDDAPEFDPADLEVEFGEAAAVMDDENVDVAEDIVVDDMIPEGDDSINLVDDIAADDDPMSLDVDLDTVADEAAVAVPAEDLMPAEVPETMDVDFTDEDNVGEGDLGADLEDLLPSMDDLEDDASEMLMDNTDLEAVIGE